MEHQLSLFAFSEETTKSLPPPHIHEHPWLVYIDGASRGNPGPAGAGIYIANTQHLPMRYGYAVGIKTNNQAEYLALCLALFLVKSACPLTSHSEVIIHTDSELLVRQMQGSYRIKNLWISSLHAMLEELSRSINYRLVHVMRHNNKEADRLANLGIDRRTPPPEPFVAFLNRHGIEL